MAAPKKRAPARPKNPRFEVYDTIPNTDPRTMGSRIRVPDWRWRLLARNGEIVASGEGYTTEKDAHRGVKAVKRAVLAIVAAEEAALQPKIDLKSVADAVANNLDRHRADYERIGEATRPLRKRGRTQ